MTEAEWLACAEPSGMLEFLGEDASQRKMRLFAVACCRNVWHLFTDEQCRHSIEAAERFADGRASYDELVAAYPARYVTLDLVSDDLYYLVDALINHASSGNVSDAYYVYRSAEIAAGVLKANEHCAILRDIANPFASGKIKPASLSATAASIAEAIYDDRAFDRLPILADALEEAGCTDADILDHCRRPGEHARGCWVVDLLLGKR